MNSCACEKREVHRPVMVREVVEFISPRAGGLYLDCTLGAGGHARAILEATEGEARLIGIELDPDMVKVARENLSGFESVRVIPGNYRDARDILASEGVEGVDGLILDLGFSSYHVDESGRGFSFRWDEPLDMRYSPGRTTLTARDVVNTFSEETLEQIIRTFGEERDARRIARSIVRIRKKTPIRTSGELAAIVRDAVRDSGGRRRIDPATRTFQALRIFVNRELENLKEFLTHLPHLLNPGGRAVIISYHSLEDRLVKTSFRRFSGKCVCPPGTPLCACGKVKVLKVLTPKPLLPSREEARENPRSRSAKLRAAEKEAGE